MITSPLVDRDKYSELFLRTTRLAVLLSPFAAAIYGLAIYLDLVVKSPAYQEWALLVVLILFITMGVAQYLYKPHTPRTLAIYIGLYHLLSLSTLFFGSGTVSALSLLWILTIIISDIFYGWRVGAVSALLYLLVSAALFSFEPIITPAIAITYLIFAMMVVTTGALVGALRGVQRVEHSDLQRSKQQEQLQRSQLTALINSVEVAIISTSSAGTIRVYNAAMLNMLDTNESLSGRTIDEVLHLRDQAGETVSLMSTFTAANHILERDDLSHQFSENESIRLSISCAPIKGHYSSQAQTHEGFIFILRDITKSKSLEEERDEFISVVSHELRTPVTITEGTLSNLQLLLDRGHDPKQLSSALKDAHEQIVYLSSMINDLSTLSRAERGIADAHETVNVRELLEELYRRYQNRAENKKLQLNLHIPHQLGNVKTSRLYLQEILQNFITNAIKYTEEGSVTIAAEQKTEGIEFTVSDTGIGISKSDINHIFEKFYRSEDYRTRVTAGTGLGLYVVTKLSAKLGVTVDVDSRLNHGSSFRFVLPKRPPSKAHLTKANK